MPKKQQPPVGIRYSEPFKLEVVRRWEEGQYSSMSHLLRATGVKSDTTVKSWLVKYGNTNSVPKTMRIETTNEQNELTQARKKIRELEAALSQMTMRSLLSDSYLQIACEELDCDVEVF